MDAFHREEFRREIEVRGHRLLVYLNRMLNLRAPLAVQYGAELRVYLACHNQWGKLLRFRPGVGYHTFERCAVCGRQKTEKFSYNEIRPLLPAEWWPPGSDGPHRDRVFMT